MPEESLRNSESSGKRKLKTKAPKRLRRKNKQNIINTEENITNDIPITDKNTSLTKENVPLISNTSPLNTDNKQEDASTSDYWKYCTKKALDILEKQASNRQKLLIERHQERIHSIQYVLYQREQIDMLNEKNHTMSESLDSLRDELRTKDEELKIVKEKLDNRNELVRDNEFLRVQLKLMEQKFERFTSEYSKKVEENRQHEHEYTEQIQSLIDEIERIKRDLVLEEYRKQEAERKVRYYDEKIKIEQNFNKKIQQDLIQLKQELKSVHARYDSLQIEMLEMHKANNNDVSLIPTKDTDDNQWLNKRDEQVEIQRSKRKTRDRTESSASTTSNCSEKRNKIAKKPSKNKENDSDNPSLTVKRKTKTTKKHLPMVKVTQASPSSDQAVSVEKDSTQLLLPPSTSATSDGSTATTDSHNTSCESQQQPLKPRTKKQSRYPCRRAQRPVKQTDTTDQIKQ